MKNSNVSAKYIGAIALCIWMSVPAFSANPVVIDFSRTDKGGGGVTAKEKPSVTAPPKCDPSSSWTCKFVSGDANANRSVDNVATAHINMDGSVLLQEDDASKQADDLWSVTLPSWYVSNGRANYLLLGTDCSFTIKPIIENSVVTDWTLSVKGKKGLSGLPDTCGGETDKVADKKKAAKLKTTPSPKGPAIK